MLQGYENRMATAILDRLLHHSYVITIRGDSYRLKSFAGMSGGSMQGNPEPKGGSVSPPPLVKKILKNNPMQSRALLWPSAAF